MSGLNYSIGIFGGANTGKAQAANPFGGLSANKASTPVKKEAPMNSAFDYAKGPLNNSYDSANNEGTGKDLMKSYLGLDY